MNSTATDSSTCRATGSHWLRAGLFVVETIGVVIFYWKGLPLLRLVAEDPAAYEMNPELRLWLLAGIAFVQIGYWTRYRMGPAITTFTNPVLGHVVLFVSRLVFIFPAAVFGVLFLFQRLAPQMPLIGYVLALAGLFSAFLFMQDLQEMGSNLVPKREKSPPRA